VEPVDALSLEEIDLSDLDFWARPWAEREGAFRLLRRERPMPFFAEPVDETAPIELPVGPGYYALTRHRDITEVSRNPETYCSGKGAVSIIDLPPEMVEYFSGLISTDDPRHARLRRIVANAFNPRRIAEIERSIDAVAAQVVDEVAPLGSCDFVTEVAAQLPLRIIADMMGLPESSHADIFRCSNTILSMGDPEYIPEGLHPIEAFLAAGAELTAMMQEMGEYRRTHPVDDLTSDLVNSSIDGESLSAQELASFFVLLVTAGNETTRTAIAHGLNVLTENPEQLALWQSDPDRHTRGAVEEIVRWASPVIWMRRTVTRDTVLSGVELHEGDKLLLFYSSANRDEAVFDDPYRFDITRNPNPHLGFGAAGPHFCLGAHLARREIGSMFRHLFAVIPDLRASGPPDQLCSSFVNGIKHLPCEFTPRA
jgi:methyl-branched lipid omega-hydroxylase